MSGLFLSLEDPAILVVEGVAEVLPLSRVLRTQLQAGLWRLGFDALVGPVYMLENQQHHEAVTCPNVCLCYMYTLELPHHCTHCRSS